MLSFHGELDVKLKYAVARVEACQNGAKIIRMADRSASKERSSERIPVSNEYSRYPFDYGLPKWLTNLEDILLDTISEGRAVIWLSEYVTAIPVGISEEDLTLRVKAPFLLIVMESALSSFDNGKYPDCAKAIQTSMALWKRDDIGSKDWEAAALAARNKGGDDEKETEQTAWLVMAAIWAATGRPAPAARGVIGAAAAAALWKGGRPVAIAKKTDYFAAELLNLVRDLEPEQGRGQSCGKGQFTARR